MSCKNTKQKVCNAAQIAGLVVAGLMCGGLCSELRLGLELTWFCSLAVTVSQVQES